MNSDQQNTDVILRASDGKLFYAWKMFLSFSSPVFRDMFSLLQPDTPNTVDILQHDGRPVVELTENSSTIGHILSLCQPPGCSGKQFKLNSVQELQDVLEASTKYDMQNLHSVAIEELNNPSFLRADPLVIFALACQYDYPEAARLAAKHTLALSVLVRSYVPELERINGGQLCRLLLYREACASAACTLAQDHTWVTYSDFAPLLGCMVKEADVGYIRLRYPPSRKYRSGRVETVTVHLWLSEYMKKSEDALRRFPHGDAVRDQKLVNDVRSAISSSKCEECDALEVWGAFQTFVDTFAKEVNLRVAEVEINLGF